jgi:hypothetical protein
MEHRVDLAKGMQMHPPNGNMGTGLGSVLAALNRSSRRSSTSGRRPDPYIVNDTRIS